MKSSWEADEGCVRQDVLHLGSPGSGQAKAAFSTDPLRTAAVASTALAFRFPEASCRSCTSRGIFLPLSP